MSDKRPPDPFLRVIAFFKLIKSVLFIGLGVALLYYVHKDVQERLQALMNDLHVDSDNHIARWCLSVAGQATSVKLESLSAICFFYALLFGTEGTGLYLRKKWAEYFVVIVTASALPLEIYEIYLKVSLLKIALISGNLVILGYLIYVIRRKKK
jgi:uncharacterized membrane protein (DUF2068 family)